MLNVLFSIGLPAFVFGFARAFLMVGFVLFFLPRYPPSNDGFMWLVFFLAVFGLWKACDKIEQFARTFLIRLNAEKAEKEQ